jgi:hypothetical protein
VSRCAELRRRCTAGRDCIGPGNGRMSYPISKRGRKRGRSADITVISVKPSQAFEPDAAPFAF